MGPGEGILYYDADIQDVIIPKLILDYAGHYNRSDIFSLAIREDDGDIVTRTSSATLQASDSIDLVLDSNADLPVAKPRLPQNAKLTRRKPVSGEKL